MVQCSFQVVNSNPKVIVVGAGGRLGAALARAYVAHGEVISFTRSQLDLGELDAFARDARALVF